MSALLKALFLLPLLFLSGSALPKFGSEGKPLGAGEKNYHHHSQDGGNSGIGIGIGKNHRNGWYLGIGQIPNPSWKPGSGNAGQANTNPNLGSVPGTGNAHTNHPGAGQNPNCAGNATTNPSTIRNPSSTGKGSASLGIGENPNLGWASGQRLDFEAESLGSWRLHSAGAGVSSMHIQLLPNNKAIMFDTTRYGPSKIRLPQPNPANCRPVPHGKPNQVDCWAHAVEYDVDTAFVRPLKILTDTWCSSGGLTTDGNLLNTGGFEDGGKAVRIMSACNNCDWKENANALSDVRWYATQQMLEDGSFVVVGGRKKFDYEFVPNSLNFPIKVVNLPFLKETTDDSENNLYPFVYLAPDGNLFIFANNRAILLAPATAAIVRNFPALPGGSRNYPASGMSALLPIKLTADPAAPVDAQVLICGGAKPEAYKLAEKGTFVPALQDCGRISITEPDSQWEIDNMPSRRVMGDMLHLPTTDLLILNGATSGSSGWQLADRPNLTPLLYSAQKKIGERFKALSPSTIPRMYHSTSALLETGEILVAGSNTNPTYNFTNLVKYKTELRVEKFSPPYLDPMLDKHRPRIQLVTPNTQLGYEKPFTVQLKLSDADVTAGDIKVTMIAPPFTTHGYSQNQRMLVLAVTEATNQRVTAVAPPSKKVAPPGFYLLFVVNRGVPSRGKWVQMHA